MFFFCQLFLALRNSKKNIFCFTNSFILCYLLQIRFQTGVFKYFSFVFDLHFTFFFLFSSVQTTINQLYVWINFRYFCCCGKFSVCLRFARSNHPPLEVFYCFTIFNAYTIANLPATNCVTQIYIYKYKGRIEELEPEYPDFEEKTEKEINNRNIKETVHKTVHRKKVKTTRHSYSSNSVFFATTL